jgi:undecaprenyl diphosphate synthase
MNNTKIINPKHIAIIMDGNGRWAKAKGLMRTFGHKKGMDCVRSTVEACSEKNIQALTLFAFSTENWRRPEEEVGYLMGLFLAMMRNEVGKLHKNNVVLRIIGDRSRFSDKLQKAMSDAEELTKDNTGLSLNIAANYGGRLDITEATRILCRRVANGELDPEDVTVDMLQAELSLHHLPEPDLLIRTGGEKRVSNFLLWQLAYGEFYFTDSYWPDFDKQALDKAIISFSSRQRRFGKTGDQIIQKGNERVS